MAKNRSDQISSTSSTRARNGYLLLICMALSAACSPASPDLPVANSKAALPPIVVRESALRDRPATPAPAPAPTPRPIAAAAPAPGDDGFAITATLAPDRPLEPGDYLWDAEGVAAGPLSIVVDIAAQKMFVYRGGVEIGRAFIVYGHDDKPTPEGIFPILQKRKDHVSNLYGAEMPYMMRLTWDGVAIHAAEVDDRYATHGCVGIPDEFAATLFAQAKVGDKVMVTNGWQPDVYAAEAPASTV